MKIIRIIIVICIIGLGLYIGKKYLIEPNSNITVYEDKENPLATFTINENIQVNSFEDNTFFITTRNSTKLINKKGEVLWENPISLSNPKTVNSSNYLVTGNSKGGSFVNVFNENGYLYSINESNEIVDFTINDNGYVSIIEKDNTGYIILLYDNNGEEILKKTMYDTNIYPMKAVCSQDSSILAYSAINTNFMEVKSDVSFLFTSGNETNQYVGTSGEFAAKNFDNEIIYNIEFIKNKIFVFSDINIYIYEYTTNDIVLLSTIELNNILIDYDFIDNKYLAISLGSGQNSQSRYNTGTILIYDFNGEIIKERYGNDVEAYISSDTTGIIIRENRNLTYLHTNGNILWEYTSSVDLKDAFYMGTGSKAVITTNNSLIAIKENN